MNIYDIDQKMRDLVDPETGELSDYESFCQLAMEREKKIENAVMFYKELMAKADAIKGEIKNLTERKSAAESKANRLKGYVEMALDGQKFQTARCAVSFRKTPESVKIQDANSFTIWAESSGRDDLLRYKEPDIQKSEVKALINRGIEVPFVSLESGKSMVVK